MIAVIPLAGKSERFTKEGYELPKWSLPMPDGKPMLCKIIESLGHVDKVIVIGKPEHEELFGKTVYQVTSGNVKVIMWRSVKSNTLGPLDTVLRIKRLLKTEEELLINYCDCFLIDGCDGFTHQMRNSRQDAAIVGFNSNDSRFQYDPTGRYALGGIYWFRRADKFVKNSNLVQIASNVGPAQVAMTFYDMGLNRWSVFDDSRNYVDLGTPAAYETYLALHKKIESVEIRIDV